MDSAGEAARCLPWGVLSRLSGTYPEKRAGIRHYPTVSGLGPVVNERLRAGAIAPEGGLHEIEDLLWQQCLMEKRPTEA